MPDFTDTEKHQQSIAPSVRALHGYWLKQREDFADTPMKPFVD
jgi:hypothetical protein